ncbi:MAG: nucleotidyltransferase domain-containing protein [Clostridium sp.]|jgi:DNA polymerase beta subunit|uniref:nucleotidyltransferase domain-containing protein n=1 Tax=uncultured Clostridium sp. TaxID=59620 RepID=UPI00260032D1|nr:nucleotidyltransferase domain-containing protein [uncultured Clostridium sp.]MCI6693334.1 nucleotidyltransferase domain-containing protein [Clostridium sp.]
MAKSIIDYQNAYKEITELLKKNNNILSIFIFGSMVSGDLWEGSNIDLFVIYKEDFHEIRDVYSEVSGIPIHIKIISKELFKKYYNEAGKREFIKNSLISSKMIYSIDDEITDLYQKIIYMIDSDKGRLNLVYLGNFFKEIGICKKYIGKVSIYTAYELLLRALNNFSMLFLSINGYTVSKDSLTMACNLNDILNDKVKNLIYKEVDDITIKELLDYMENYLEYNIEKASMDLINFIKNENRSLSAYDIKINPYFKNFKIKIEEILKVLYKNNIITQEKRELRDSKGNFLAMENVYSYKN